MTQGSVSGRGASDDSEHRNRYSSIVENAPEILALLGAEGIIRYVNPHTEKILGYRQDELVGRRVFDFVHPEDVPRTTQEYLRTTQQEGEHVPSIVRLRHREGAWVAFEIIANNQLLDPRSRAVIFTARDLRFCEDLEAAIHQANTDTQAEAGKRVTALAKINAELRIENQGRRQAESQLRHSVSLLTAALDSTADGILVVSPDRKVRRCNAKFAEMWHLRCDSVAGSDDRSLLVEVADQLENPNEFLSRVSALHADPSATSFDVLHFKDGRIFERYSQAQRIQSQIVGRVWSFRDVTRATNLERELQHAQKMEALGRLSAGIAHDFNNLLAVISGCAIQLKDNPALKDGNTECDQILASSRRAASLTKQLLTFSRKQAGVPVVVDLNLIVVDLERMLRHLLSSRVQLEIAVSKEPQPVCVDVSQIEMMIINLVVNAHDAMPDGGRLSIATRRKTFTRDQLEKSGENSVFVVLEITDTGHGMTPEVQARIFEPFFTTKPVGRGTGLGLSTVLSTVKQVGGQIEVHSESNHGATFTVYIPRLQAAPDDVAQTVPATPLGGHETVLLAEGESGIRAMTRTYLETLGYRILEAADGSEAIQWSREDQGSIDLVLTDLCMLDAQGNSALRAIRKNHPSIKAIFLSSEANVNLSEDYDSILEKPFELPKLGSVVRAILDARAVHKRCS